MELIKIDKLPSHCSELYGCPPEKYDQEIEAEKKYSAEMKKYNSSLGEWNEICFDKTNREYKFENLSLCRSLFPDRVGELHDKYLGFGISKQVAVKNSVTGAMSLARNI